MPKNTRQTVKRDLNRMYEHLDGILGKLYEITQIYKEGYPEILEGLEGVTAMVVLTQEGVEATNRLI